MKGDRFKFILTTVSGNVMEWYDFALYGYFATIIGKLFFPSEDQFFSLLLTFSAFASGFLSRILGSFFFGHIGDRYGRRNSLLISISLIILPTVAIGLLPTYASIGVWSPILLVACRLLQGLAVSGELTAAGIYLLECSHQRQQGFNGSLVMCSIYIGLLIGAAICTSITLFYTPREIEQFAWRIPFLISLFFGVGALLLRIKSQDSPAFKALTINDEIANQPLLIALKNYLPNILSIGIMSGILAVVIYLLIAYLPTYFLTHLNMSLYQSMLLSSAGLLTLSFTVPCMGFISDRLGYYKLFAIACTAFIAFGYSVFDLLNAQKFNTVLFGVVSLSFLLSPISATIMTLMTRAFPSYVRCSGVSLGYNLSMAIFGGTAPLMALTSTQYFGFNTVFVGYLTIIAILSLLAVSYLQKIDQSEVSLLEVTS